MICCDLLRCDSTRTTSSNRRGSDNHCSQWWGIWFGALGVQVQCWWQNFSYSNLQANKVLTLDSVCRQANMCTPTNWYEGSSSFKIRHMCVKFGKWPCFDHYIYPGSRSNMHDINSKFGIRTCFKLTSAFSCAQKQQDTFIEAHFEHMLKRWHTRPHIHKMWHIQVRLKWQVESTLGNRLSNFGDESVFVIAIFLKVRVKSCVNVDNGHEHWNRQINHQQGGED